MTTRTYYAYVFRARCQHPGLAPNEMPAGMPEKAAVIHTSPELATQLLTALHPEYAEVEWDVEIRHEVTMEASKNPHVLYTQVAPERPPLLTANQMYEHSRDNAPDFEYIDIYTLFGGRVDDSRIPDGANTRLATRVVSAYHGSRCHCVDSVWFDDLPIAVLQVSGRPDFRRVIVTDLVKYTEAEQYMVSLYATEYDDDLLVLDPDTPDRRLNLFYGHYAHVDISS